MILHMIFFLTLSRELDYYSITCYLSARMDRWGCITVGINEIAFSVTKPMSTWTIPVIIVVATILPCTNHRLMCLRPKLITYFH